MNNSFTTAAAANNTNNTAASRNTQQRVRRLAAKWEIELVSGRTLSHSVGSVRTAEQVEADEAVLTSDVLAACTDALTAYGMIDEDCKRSVDTGRVRIRRAFTKRSIQVIGVYGFRSLAGFAQAVCKQATAQDELDGLLQAYLAAA